VLWIAALVTLLFGSLGVAGFLWMRSDALATLTQFTGQPERDTVAALEQWRSARSGDDFEDGEGARTPDASVAHFKLINGATLKLEQASLVRFKRSVDSRRLRVDVGVGEAEIRSGVGPITLDSEFGPIVLDANSTITLTRNGAQLNVGVELGSIQISGRTVGAGDSVQLEIGGIVLDPPAAKAIATAAPAATAEEPQAPELVVGNGLSRADIVVAPGDSFVVHDPSPPTAVGFRVADVCDGPARLIAGSQQTEAAAQANLRFDAGQHAYEVRCLNAPDVVAATGGVRVLQDAGTRRLPTFTPSAMVSTDGRRYTVMYQHKLPTVTVSWPTAPRADSYTLKIGGRSVKTSAPRHTFASLSRGTHHIVFTADTTPARQSRGTTIEVVYDTQAPAARVSGGPTGFTPGENVTITGQAMPGWEVSVAGRALDVDAKQQFTVDHDGAGPLPITFSHPTRGTHYYLRRPKTAP
jgi:hypothetical protein